MNSLGCWHAQPCGTKIHFRFNDDISSWQHLVLQLSSSFLATEPTRTTSSSKSPTQGQLFLLTKWLGSLNCFLQCRPGLKLAGKTVTVGPRSLCLSLCTSYPSQRDIQAFLDAFRKRSGWGNECDISVFKTCCCEANWLFLRERINRKQKNEIVRTIEMKSLPRKTKNELQKDSVRREIYKEDKGLQPKTDHWRNANSSRHSAFGAPPMEARHIENKGLPWDTLPKEVLCAMDAQACLNHTHTHECACKGSQHEWPGTHLRIASVRTHPVWHGSELLNLWVWTLVDSSPYEKRQAEPLPFALFKGMDADS